MSDLVKKTIKVGSLILKNRLMMAPMATHSSDMFGNPTQKTLEYYEEKSDGGYLGLLETEHTYIAEIGKADPFQLSSATDSTIEGLSQLASVIHKNGSKAMLQINHAGSASRLSYSGKQPLGPSSLINPSKRGLGEIPREMTKNDIKLVIKQFVTAAKRAKLAGFDAVELHAAHGYLLNQFYSPLSNHRDDEYNGYTLEGRIRLLKEILRALRIELGEKFVISMRFGGCDYIPGGSTIEDAVAAAVELEKTGLDLLNVSGGMCMYSNPNTREPAWFKDMTKAIREKVSIPVVLTGNIKTRETIDMVLENGMADIVGSGRSILTDSNWAKTVLEL